jgi:hypothetical protein
MRVLENFLQTQTNQHNGSGKARKGDQIKNYFARTLVAMYVRIKWKCSFRFLFALDKTHHIDKHSMRAQKLYIRGKIKNVEAFPLCVSVFSRFEHLIQIIYKTALLTDFKLVIARAPNIFNNCFSVDAP